MNCNKKEKHDRPGHSAGARNPFGTDRAGDSRTAHDLANSTCTKRSNHGRNLPVLDLFASNMIVWIEQINPVLIL